ncbi:hypothetical protein FE257_003875 [Aspergillus nanangensis]|uniref:DUF3074 domain-containing protein n=1 Tax=Aspergillus nanangensis TaxID=2582783 RepID=A0AAD4CC91_ASPNN|nr:hypothetical protein FE257_003875 [Aspergillus nanangensis]
MPLRITSAPVSGVKKRKNPASARPRASPFATHARRKPTTSSCSDSPKPQSSVVENQSPLPDVGVSHYIPQTARVENVVQALEYVRDSMFEDLPASRGGMNSTRIAEVLNFRRSLPPLASVAHVHTLLDAPTKVEKEILELVNTGRVRRLIVSGRGNDAAGLGDCLVLAEDWERLVKDSGALDPSLKEKFLEVLSQMRNTSAVPGRLFSPPEYMSLASSGLMSLRNFTPTSSAGNSASRTNQGSPLDTGGHRLNFHAATLFLSLPNTGPYLGVLGAGRAHLLSLLRRSISNEVPLTLLRDRWDGAVETNRSFSVAKRVRGEPRTSTPSTAKVQLSTSIVPTADIRQGKEFWACRTSVHQNAPVHGTASWDEFRSGLRENHVENEMEYTPSVTAIERLLTWPIEGKVEGGWGDVEMQVNMITHTFHPAPLIRPRTFIVLAISATLPDVLGNGFMTTQLPLAGPDHDSIPSSLREKIIHAVPQNTIFASYASVEQVILQGNAERIEWRMATTSDAGGAIPQWVQRSWTMGGVPKAIVADVGLFIAWTSRRRASTSI